MLGPLAGTLAPIRRRHNLPALAGAVVTSRGIRAEGAVGVRKHGDPTPVTLDDRFHLGSCTKGMTADILATLVEQGKLSWSMTLREALPDLAATMNSAYRDVKLDQLLGHRAGFTEESWPSGMDFGDVWNLPGAPTEQRAAYTAKVLREKPAHRPASRFHYSNRSYVVAGAIAERAAGASWETLMRERLFRPLGMTTAGFGPMGQPGRVNEPWQHTRQNGLPAPIIPVPRADNPTALGPAGTCHASIRDWAKYAAAHLKGERGEAAHLKPEALKRLHTAPYGEYGFGWLVAERPWAGGTVLNHAGSNNQNYCVIWLAPLKDFAVLVMTNIGGAGIDAACDEAAGALIGWHLKQTGG
jgi:CubicO group peptidase (beta-lactamase class C family)